MFIKRILKLPLAIGIANNPLRDLAGLPIIGGRQ